MIAPTANHETDTLPDGAAPAVRVSSLRKVIDDRVVLRDLELTVPAGSFIALLGANGAGKSTLLKILAGLIPATLGSVELFGRTLSQESAALRSRIGFIGHGAMLYRELSARENLVFFGKLYGLRDAARRADELLDRMGLAARAGDPVKTYSRGMTQRAAIARALLCNPDLLLADEPFSGLDVPSTRTLEAILTSLHHAGKTIILANHDVSQSLRLAERVLVLDRGRIALCSERRRTAAAHAPANGATSWSPEVEIRVEEAMRV